MVTCNAVKRALASANLGSWPWLGRGVLPHSLCGDRLDMEGLQIISIRKDPVKYTFAFGGKDESRF